MGAEREKLPYVQKRRGKKKFSMAIACPLKLADILLPSEDFFQNDITCNLYSKTKHNHKG